tara:strand:+ start:849 stop:2081 length:1233 start_codon:yes stop_codon:yes gene_type:complete
MIKKEENKPTSESKESESEDGKDENKPKFISQSEILGILFSRETLYHVLALFIILAIFGVLSWTKHALASEFIIIFGYGVSMGYFLTANLNRFDGVRNLSRSESPTSLIMPSLTSLLFSSIIFFGVNHSNYGENITRLLSFGLIFVFIIWQFAQAWWMRVPFKEFALRRMDNYPDKGSNKIGFYLNIFSPIMWTAIGLLLFYALSLYLDEFSENFNQLFIIFWLFLMTMMASASFYLLKKMSGNFWYDPKVASFSAFFAIGYWGFLSYHAAVFLYSFFNEPSFVFDLFFMIITIILVIYSLSVQTLRTEARRAHLKDSNHYIGKATGLMGRHNVIFYAISFTVAYGASNFFLANSDTSLIGGFQGVSRVSHLIVIASGIIVLLIVNYNLLTGRGLISEGFVESMRNPKDN